jgi:DNA/RNA endonuclease YhcR with UshA esterase domain
MKNIFSHKILLFALLILSFSSCRKGGFDEPPIVGTNPDIVSNTLIANLKSLYTGQSLRIEDDLIIEGVVIADDKSGNFFKSLVIQDQTAGILILLDAIGLYNNYPIGRKVFIRCKDLYLGEFNGLIQLGGGVDANNSLIRLNETLIDQHLVRGPLNQTVNPIEIQITDLNNNYQNMLIKLTEMQFDDTSVTYADAANRISRNATLKNCNNESILLRNSGFAEFAGDKVPKLNGSIVAVYSVFRTDKQLLIRSPADLQMNNPRCGGSSGSDDDTLITIRQLRNFHTGSTISAISGAKKIKGVVITDRAAGNETGRNLVIQDANAGIVIRFSSNHTFNLGDEIEVRVSGFELSRFNGLLQVTNVANNVAKLISTRTPTAMTVSIDEINDNFEDLESRLVRISGASITGGATFSGSRTLNDGTGTITLFTANTATFKDEPIPAGQKTVQGIVSIFNTTKQIKIRNTNDIQ